MQGTFTLCIYDVYKYIYDYLQLKNLVIVYFKATIRLIPPWLEAVLN